jgi:hypothetical protein
LVNLDLENVLLNLFLHRVVGKFLIRNHVEKVLEFLIGNDFTTILGVLEVLFLDVLTEFLGDVNSGNKLLRVRLKETSKVTTDFNRLHKTTVVFTLGLVLISKIFNFKKLVTIVL